MTRIPDPFTPTSSDASTTSDLVALVDQLRAEVADLRARIDRDERPPSAGRRDHRPPAATTVADGSAIGRRRALMGLAGVAAAGTVGALASASPSAAADGDPLLLGTANEASRPTSLTAGDDASYVLGVTDGDPHIELANRLGGSTFGAVATGGRSDTAVLGVLDGEDGKAAVEGRATGQGIGVFGGSVRGAGVRGRSEDDIAGQFQNHTADIPAVVVTSPGIGVGIEGGLGHLYLHPVPGSPVAATTEGITGVVRVQGDVQTDATAWMCVAPGTPGTWRKLAGPETAGSLHLLPAPVRIYDSRPGGAPAIGPKTPLPAGNVARTIDLKANGGGVPAGATGALVTVLLLDATAGAGNFTIWANDEPKPSANTLVWGGDAGRFTTLAVTAVDAQARVKVDARLRTHVALDVVGYFR